MESILLEDNKYWFDNTCYDSFTSHHILPKALNFIHTKEILAIIGARRVGKSTLSKLNIKELLKTINMKNIFLLILKNLYLYPLKMIQTFKNWEVFIKVKYENTKKREVNAFKYFNSLPDTNKKLITYDFNGQDEDIEIISCDNSILLK